MLANELMVCIDRERKGREIGEEKVELSTLGRARRRSCPVTYRVGSALSKIERERETERESE